MNRKGLITLIAICLVILVFTLVFYYFNSKDKRADELITYYNQLIEIEEAYSHDIINYYDDEKWLSHKEIENHKSDREQNSLNFLKTIELKYRGTKN